jgi:hypothetical protein
VPGRDDEGKLQNCRALRIAGIFPGVVPSMRWPKSLEGLREILRRLGVLGERARLHLAAMAGETARISRHAQFGPAQGFDHLQRAAAI